MFYTIQDIVNFLPEPIYTHLYETNANDNAITACGAMYAGELVNVYRCNENNNKTGLWSASRHRTNVLSVY